MAGFRSTVFLVAALVLTLAALGAGAQMVLLDLHEVKGLGTDLSVRPEQRLGNQYIGLMGIVMLCAGSAMLCYKKALGFRAMVKSQDLAETAVTWYTGPGGKPVPRR